MSSNIGFHKKGMTLQNKFIRLFAFVSSGIVIISAALYSYFSISSIEASIKNESKTIITIIANNIQAPLYFSDYPTLNEILDPILKIKEIAFISVYDFNKQLITPRESPLLTQQLLAESPIAKGPSEVFRSTSVLVISAPVFHEDTVLGTVYLGYSLKKQNSQLLKSIIGVLVFGVGLIALSFIPIQSFSRRITDPLRHLVGTMEDISAGDDEKRVAVISNDEIGHLANIFNKMMDDISQVDKLKVALNEKDELLSEIRRHQENQAEIEAQLQQAQKLESIGTMVGGISHELNNVLQSMFLLGELIQEDLPDDKTLQKHLSLLLNEGKKARDIVKQVLTFSRKTKVAMKQQPLHPIILETLVLEQAALPANIELRQNIDMNCGSVLCDKTQIHQIIINLCNNAKHAMGEQGGVLTVNLHQVVTSMGEDDTETDALELEIRDSGHGMDSETISKVFDPFFTTKDLGVGTGLGLSVIHGIINMMNGQISVTSEPGKGSSFKIHLPVGIETEEGIPTQIESPGKINFRSILLVDDQESIRSSMQSVLARMGFIVETAADGEQALRLFQASPEKYDIIVSDLSMPVMPGDELTKKIRKQDKQIPIILSTGHLGAVETAGYLDIGISAYLTKPWTADELIECIKGIDD